jgi:hypothetical protein
MSEPTGYGGFAHRFVAGGWAPRAVLPDRRACVRQCLAVVTIRSALLSLAALTALSACGGDDAPSAERFCGEVAANKDALTNPQIIYSDDIEPVLDLYRDVGAFAPLEVEDDWDQLVSAYETASTVVIGDQESEQAALTAAYSSERSAAAIELWLMANCAVDIGPVFTIVPQTAVTAPAAPDPTTSEPSTTDATVPISTP